MWHVVYENDAEEDVERCFLLDERDKDGQWKDATWLVQRKPKGRGVLLTQAQVRRCWRQDKPDLAVDPYRRPKK